MYSEYKSCQLCPRQCGCDRTAGQAGYCGQTADCRIASITPHHGEEPCLSGSRGSGTIFFSGCSCGCFFCQNHQISLGGQGHVFTAEELYDSAVQLVARGVHNLNLVTPDHFWPHLRQLITRLRQDGIDLPIVWNTSAYCNADVLRQQLDLVDIFLPDFKFADPSLATRCMGDSRYPALARAALRLMADHAGFLRPWDTSGEICARRGLLVRHLVLPGELANSREVLQILHDDFGPNVPISLMGQFRPMPACQQRGELNRQLTSSEYTEICDYAQKLGFQRLFTQPEYGDPDFLPDFRRKQPFEGNQKF